MENVAIIAQLTIAFSIIIVWVFRFDNIVVEFKQYGLSDLIRSMVGASKIALSTLLVVGIFYKEVVFVSNSECISSFKYFLSNSSGVFKFVKCQPPSFIIFKSIYFVSENRVSNRQKGYFLSFMFLNQDKDFNLLFLQPFVPGQIILS